METSRRYTLEESLAGLDIPDAVRADLVLIDVEHLSFEGDVRAGQIVIHQALASELEELFQEMLRLRFPIEKVIPIVAYDWDDLASMADNNTSAFNYRLIMHTDRLSNHSFGRAIDINPALNPYFGYDKNIYPEGATFNESVPGTIAVGGEVVRLFKDKGWEWGGEWTVVVDYQHFQKL